MIDNYKRQVPFEDELNRSIRTEVTENPYLYFFLLRPLDKISLRLLPFFIIGEVNAKCVFKKHLRLWGGPGMCSTEHTKF